MSLTFVAGFVSHLCNSQKQITTPHCVQQFQVSGNLLLEMVIPDLGPVDLMACSIFGGDGNFGRYPHPCHSVDQSKITELAVLSKIMRLDL